MRFFKFIKDLLGFGKTEQESTPVIETFTVEKKLETVASVVKIDVETGSIHITPTPVVEETKVEEPIVSEVKEEPKKTAKEIKAKIKKSVDPNKESKPKQKPKQGE